LVLTLFNWARPRDLSHFETFEHYHATFYKHVEALSVTPFAPRALDRGLSGVFISLMRLLEEWLNANLGAQNVADTDPLFARVFEIIKHRAVETTGDKSLGPLIEKMLTKPREAWLNRKHKAVDHKLRFRSEGQSIVGLLEEPQERDWELFTCLNSRRDVEASVNLLYDSKSAGLRTDLGEEVDHE